MTLDLRKHHAKKDGRRADKLTLAEKRRRPNQAEPSARRATRGGGKRPGRRR